jgi:hypothetical protein
MNVKRSAVKRNGYAVFANEQWLLLSVFFLFLFKYFACCGNSQELFNVSVITQLQVLKLPILDSI